MEIEKKQKKFQRANLTPRKFNIFKQNINTINSLQSVKPVQKNKFSKVNKKLFQFKKKSATWKKILTTSSYLEKKIKQRQTGDCLRHNIQVS